MQVSGIIFVLAITLSVALAGLEDNIDINDPKVREALSNLEKVNVKDLMKKRNVINSYFKCAFDTGPCDALASNFKKFLHPGMHTEAVCCKECSEKARAQVILIVRYIRKYYEDQYFESINKFLDGKEPAELKALFQDISL